MVSSASVTLFIVFISTAHSLYIDTSREEPEDGSGELVSDDWSTSLNFPQTIILPPGWDLESNAEPVSTSSATTEFFSELHEVTTPGGNGRQVRQVQQLPAPPRRRPMPVQPVSVPKRVVPVARPPRVVPIVRPPSGPTFAQMQHHASLHLYD